MIRRAEGAAEKAVLVAYLGERIGVRGQALVGQMPFEVFRVERSGRPAGAVLYTNFRESSIEFTAAGEPGWMTRQTIREMFAFPFVELKVWNLLALIKRGNRVARETSRGLGFTELCVLESGGAKRDDIILHNMTRDKCRWLPGAKANRRVNSNHGGVTLHG